MDLAGVRLLDVLVGLSRAGLSSLVLVDLVAQDGKLVIRGAYPVVSLSLWGGV